MLSKKDLDQLTKDLRALMAHPSFKAFVTVLDILDKDAIAAIRTMGDLETESARSLLRHNEMLREQFRLALTDGKHDPFNGK